jgi:hypothetical protein
MAKHSVATIDYEAVRTAVLVTVVTEQAHE